eukprot:scaffold7377_cov257-Pinguiococcus_pyrenoidosus.AAC.3
MLLRRSSSSRRRRRVASNPEEASHFESLVELGKPVVAEHLAGEVKTAQISELREEVDLPPANAGRVARDRGGLGGPLSEDLRLEGRETLLPGIRHGFLTLDSRLKDAALLLHKQLQAVEKALVAVDLHAANASLSAAERRN